MTGNVTRIRNPITPVVVKAKVRRQLSCLFFPAPVVFGQGGGGWWTTMCIKLCGSWMEIEFQDIIHFFVIFLKMYLVKWICLNVFVQIYLSKCISQNVFVKCICQNVFFSCLSISLIKCLKGQKCLGLLFNVKNQKWLSHSVTQSVSDKVTYWAVCGQLKMYLVKWICLNVFVQIYLSKCISQNVFVKLYLSKCIFFVSLHSSDQMSEVRSV